MTARWKWAIVPGLMLAVTGPATAQGPTPIRLDVSRDLAPKPNALLVGGLGAPALVLHLGMDEQAASEDTPALALRLGMRGASARSAQQEDAGDAWGVKRNAALAVGEVLLVNGLVWAFNEYPRGANFTQINPRSWYENIKGGWKWDDNHFSTNMFAHPYHGNLYYNAARSNGFTFWESIPFAFMGSAFWECCGETHRPAINDWMATSIGGSIIGEAFYRISSTILDNQDTGGSRFWRELGAAVLDPVRGFTRLTTGRAWKVAPNPERPADHRPGRIEHTLYLGARSVFDDNPIADDSLISGFVLFDFQFGTPFSEEARKPFDWFRLQFQLNSRDKETIGRFQIRGLLVSTHLKASPSNALVLGATLNYDYINNQAVEFGGQSVTGTLASIWPLSSRFTLIGQAGADAQVFGAVNSEFAFIVETPGQERLREYDFGVGGGGRLGLGLRLNGREFVNATYRLLYMPALNGAVGTLPQIGDINATHFLQSLLVELKVPVYGHFGVGADFWWYRRQSNMNNANLNDIVQRVQEARVFGSWALSLTGVN
jgi:hypothetical protein